MVPLRVRLGHAVRELRRAAGFSQEEFAAHMDVHRTSMSSIELGKLNVRLDTLVQIANDLDADIIVVPRRKRRERRLRDAERASSPAA